MGRIGTLATLFIAKLTFRLPSGVRRDPEVTFRIIFMFKRCLCILILHVVVRFVYYDMSVVLVTKMVHPKDNYFIFIQSGLG